MRVRSHPLRVCYLIMGLFPMTGFSVEDFRDYKNPFSTDILNLPNPDPAPAIEIPMIDFTTDDTNETDVEIFDDLNETDVEIFDDLNETDVEIFDDLNETISTPDENKTKFNHPRKNWKDILSVIPTFTESENIPDNAESKSVPTSHEEDQNKEEDSNHTTRQPLYKNPINKKTIETGIPTFDESEHVPTRDTSEIIPELPNHPPKNDWELAIEFDGGWKHVEWFGYYFQPSQTHLGHGWIFHAGLGWLFLASDGFDSVWMWNSNLEQWMWTSKDVFGCLYGDQTSQWIFYNSDKNVFYDYTREKWVDIKNL